MVVAATVDEVNIVSVYPPVNGLTDQAFQAPNTIIRPRSDSARSAIHLLRTYFGSVIQSPVWIPNRFVIVLPNAVPDDLTLSIDSSPAPPILTFIIFNLYTHKTCLTYIINLNLDFKGDIVKFILTFSSRSITAYKLINYKYFGNKIFPNLGKPR